MKVKPCFFHHFGEIGVFRHEADAGMNRVRAGDRRRRQDRGNIEIAVARGRRPDADAFVGQAHMHGVGIRRRMHGDRMDAHLAAGAMDAQGDFAPIGDENFFEHEVIL